MASCKELLEASRTESLNWACTRIQDNIAQLNNQYNVLKLKLEDIQTRFDDRFQEFDQRLNALNPVLYNSDSKNSERQKQLAVIEEKVDQTSKSIEKKIIVLPCCTGERFKQARTAAECELGPLSIQANDFQQRIEKCRNSVSASTGTSICDEPVHMPPEFIRQSLLWKVTGIREIYEAATPLTSTRLLLIRKDIFTDYDGYQFQMQIIPNGTPKFWTWNKYFCVGIKMIHSMANSIAPWPVSRNLKIAVTTDDVTVNIFHQRIVHFPLAGRSQWIYNFCLLDTLFGADRSFETPFVNRNTLNIHVSLEPASGVADTDQRSETGSVAASSENRRRTRTRRQKQMAAAAALSTSMLAHAVPCTPPSNSVSTVPLKANRYYIWRISNIVQLYQHCSESLPAIRSGITFLDESGLYEFRLLLFPKGHRKAPKALTVGVMMCDGEKNASQTFPVQCKVFLHVINQETSSVQIERIQKVTFDCSGDTQLIHNVWSLTGIFGGQLNLQTSYVKHDSICIGVWMGQ